MKAYVIKRDDGKYYNHFTLSHFVNDLVNADMFRVKVTAEDIMRLIIDNKVYGVSKEELMVVAIEIKEIQE